MTDIADTRRQVADRALAYRNRNAELALPSTRDIDCALVSAVKATFERRGITQFKDLARGSFEHEVVSRTFEMLAGDRFAILDSREARDRVKKRLGLLRRRGSAGQA